MEPILEQMGHHENKKEPIILRYDGGMAVLPNPEHPNYCADVALYGKVSGLDYKPKFVYGAVMDGVGSGGEDSVLAARLVAYKLHEAFQNLFGAPTLTQAVALIKNVITEAKEEIAKMRQEKNNHQLDTTFAFAVVCRSPDGQKHFLLTANLGDTEIFVRNKDGTRDQKLTKNQSAPYSEDIIRGQKPGEPIQDLSKHPRRNIITGSVGCYGDNGCCAIHFSNIEISPGDKITVVIFSDGVGDNFSLKGINWLVDEAHRDCFCNLPAERVAQEIANRAREASETRKPDDIGVVVLYIES